MNLRALALIPALATLGAAVPAVSADAATPLVAGGSFAQTAPFIDGTLYPFECHAGSADATSVSISSCTLTDGFHTIAAPAQTAAAPAVTTSQVVAVSPLNQWKVCWTASARYADGTSRSTSGCTSASKVAGTGVSTG